ncbi:menaquinone-specific isochorismate synthase [Actinomadura coerulea]|uniref:isochorismate synthase n=1 Tax=Actinomadura coerulea TaxID=46159 RepID=A0A7X0FXD1_9ACTN|nr:menaquinone-specific isochorismate synthase [Actinomadura coerulea]GGQ31579.1 isochorismate synthase [Actinomadura coerulea]
MKLAVTAPDRLTVRTVPIPDPGDLIARLPHPSALAWIRHGQGIVGWGEAARLTLPGGHDRFDAAARMLRDLFDAAAVDDTVNVPGSGPVAFGTFGFDPKSPDSTLIIPRRVLGRRDGHAWLTTIGDDTDPLTLANPPQAPTGLRWSDGALPEHAWKHAVATAVDRIRRGHLRPDTAPPPPRPADNTGHLGKVVLARDLTVRADTPIDARVLLQRLAARYPGCYTFSCAGMVGATPELLIRRTGGDIESLVLAGTTARGDTPADDQARAARLFTSPKDREEHRYAAEMVRDALTPLCAHLTVPDEPELLTLPNVLHLASPLRGRLAADRSVLDVVAALHPTPAVCGTPTDTAMDLIRELEGMDRGRYAGPVGWIDARGDGEWGIALRCAEIDGTRARLFAGCGIVADSDPDAELAEARAKFRPMQYALHG